MTFHPRLQLGAADVTPAVRQAKCSKHAEMAPSTLDVELELDPSLLGKASLGEDVILGLKENESRLFTGLVVTANSDGNHYQLHCMDPMRIFQELRTRDAFGRGLHPVELLYYMICTTEGQKTTPAALHMDENKTLADAEWIFSRRRYVFIAPLPFCSLHTDDIAFAGASLYKANGSGRQDDRNMAGCLKNGIPDRWIDDRTMIRFYVIAEGFIDALEKGKERLRQFIDYISFVSNITTPSFNIGERSHFVRYDRTRTLTGIQESDWVYIRDTLRADRYWLHGFPVNRPADPFEVLADDPLLEPYPLFRGLFECEPERLTSPQRAALAAVHSLRQSRQAANPLDGLVHIWNCVEFLCAGHKIPNLFTDDDRKALATVAVTAAEQRFAHLEKDECRTRVERVRAILRNDLNKRPLRSVWNALCADFGVQLHPDDNDHLWKLRGIRNNHQHGRPVTVERSSLNRAGGTVEKVVLSALDRANSNK